MSLTNALRQALEHLRDEHAVPFGAELRSTLPPGVVWGLLMEAFKDSRRSALWPNRYNHLRSDGLHEGAVVRVDYNLGLVRLPLRYLITAFEPAASFTYRALPGHPLRGGATVSVYEDVAGCLLVWRGEYRHRGVSLASVFLKGFFEGRFFSALQRNLRALEGQ